MRFAVLALAALLAAPTTGCSRPARAAEQVGQATAWIGIRLDTQYAGAKVVDVVAGAPGERAGLKSGDEIKKLDGQVVKSAEDLIAKVQAKGVGSAVTLEVLRGGKTITVKLKLEARPDEVKVLRDSLMDKPAPDFAVADSTGPYAAKLADLKGNVIVVEFFATWCGPCRSSIPRMSAWTQKYGDKGLRVLAISSEEWSVVEAFAKDKKLPYTVAADSAGKVMGDAYHIPAIPTLVVIDRKGIVRHVDVGAGDKLDAVENVFVPLLK